MTADLFWGYLEMISRARSWVASDQWLIDAGD